jgi:hypothetical protein
MHLKRKKVTQRLQIHEPVHKPPYSNREDLSRKEKYKGILIMLPTRAMLCRKVNSKPLKEKERAKSLERCTAPSGSKKTSGEM